MNLAVAQTAADKYVDASVAFTGNGSFWVTPYKTLDEALVWAQGQPPTSTKTIWVAAGTYEPSLPGTPGALAKNTFTLPPNTYLLGGFKGGETLASQRTGGRYWKTVLKGDLGSVRVRHVVTCEANTVGDTTGNLGRTEIDGFTITDGLALMVVPGQPLSFEENRGGAIYAVNTSLVVRNCNFENNIAFEEGGAIFWANDSATDQVGRPIGCGVSKCIFKGNTVRRRGGAIYMDRPSQISGLSTHMSDNLDPLSHVINCAFDKNTAGTSPLISEMEISGGGAISVHNGDMGITGNTFSFNSTKGQGSAIRLTYIHNNSAIRPVGQVFANNTFYGNESLSIPVGFTGFGKVVHSQPDPAGATFPFPVSNGHAFDNSIVWGNVAYVGGFPEVDHIWPSAHYSVNFSDIEQLSGLWPLGMNVDMDPLFVNPLASDLRLQTVSMIRNAGSVAFQPQDIADVDRDGQHQSELIPYAADRIGSSFFVASNAGLDRVQAGLIDMGAMERD